MRLGILGPLLVHDGHAVVSVPAARQRTLLAALVVRTGSAVAVDELAEVVWDGAPPPAASTTLRTYVMRLRRVVGPQVGARLVARYPGYLLEAAEDEIDVLQFTRLCRDGGAAVRAGAWADAAQVLGEALELWRGEPLADVPSDLLRRHESPGLERLRLQALEWQMDAGLALGRHSELVADLESLAAAQPLSERFHAQLMLALYRCGRQAEALSAYQQARQVLVRELGTEPGTTLRELHQRMLADDPTLASPEVVTPSAPGGEVAAVVPRELPAPVGHFVGRESELAALSRSLEARSGAVVVSAVGGTAGVGKTALVVQWAHQVAERFPDGQLYVNLRGYDPGQPMAPGDALAGFLRSLGVNGQEIPADEDQRAARFRSLLSGRRVLVVLDNAGDGEQVRPLLPGSPGCMAVVTSRDPLPGLVARDGAQHIGLDLLPMAEAVGLLRALIGARVDADEWAAAALASQCARLPLALRIAAELAAARPAAALHELATDLADYQRRLDLLDAGGDPRSAVRTVFSWSYQRLDDDAARAFRLLSLHPGADFDRYAAAALTGAALRQAERVLTVLSRAYLIQPAGPGRYAMHDLLRAYARDMTASHDSDDERRAALTRLFDYVLHTAATAINTQFPADTDRRPRIPLPGTAVPPVTEVPVAVAWLEEHRPTLVAVAAHAASHGWPSHATRLAISLSRGWGDDHYLEFTTLFHHAIGGARRTGDRDAEAEMLSIAGGVSASNGRYQQATNELEQALSLSRDFGDGIRSARLLGNLGYLERRQGRFSPAAAYFQQALDLFRDLGNTYGQAQVLQNLSLIDLRQGRYEQAASELQQAQALFAEIAAWDGKASVLSILGRVQRRQGLLPQARDSLEQALELYREHGSLDGESTALADLGLVDLDQGRLLQAASRLEEALVLDRQSGDWVAQAEALNGLGEVALAVGPPSDARARCADALSMASQAGDLYEQARAHRGLARACEADGDSDRAAGHWQEALTRYADLGAPEAGEIRAHLATAAGAATSR